QCARVKQDKPFFNLCSQSRGIHLGNVKQTSVLKKVNPLLLTNVETCNPSGAKVHIDENGVLHWPVMFFYPEYGETDFIEAFCENSSFLDHLTVMFGCEGQPVPWDSDSKYTPESVQIYFENREEEKLYSVPRETTLLNALQHEKYVITGGSPSFILLAVPSKFATEFLKKYNT
ncbi:tetratricopeptide repeat protein 4-like, partial [Gigantopelta aegis]|uniref:tetratricopeptide repeat protein 4-like n=1 Tax=Gigantopelta aegis TaxID=1735272 RepID=UPI001B88AFBC